jgi:hypothetical protein
VSQLGPISLIVLLVGVLCAIALGYFLYSPVEPTDKSVAGKSVADTNELPDVPNCSSFHAKTQSGGKNVIILVDDNPIAEAAAQTARGIAAQDGYAVASFVRRRLKEIDASTLHFQNADVIVICEHPSPAFVWELRAHDIIR